MVELIGMQIPTSMVAVEPERRRRPETQGGNSWLKAWPPFRGVSPRGHGILYWRALRMAKAFA